MNYFKITGTLDRRTFIFKGGVAGLAGLGLLFGLTACGRGQDEEQTRDTAARQAVSGGDHPCGDPSTYGEEAWTTRQTFAYQEKSPDPAKTCAKCHFWQAPEGDGPCGGCTLVKGPINPQGTCRSWVEKGAAGT